MKKYTVLSAIILVFALVLGACGGDSGAKGESKKDGGGSGEKTVYKLVSLPNDGGEINKGTKVVVEEMNKALEPFNVTVEAISADDYSVVSESILTGTAHIGTPSGATYTKAHLENPNVIPLFIAAPNGKPEESGYPAYIATHIDNKSDFDGMSEEEAIKSLKDKSFCFVSATSTSGRLVPTATFWQTFGPDGTKEISEKRQVFEKTSDEGGLFSEVQFGGTHPANVDLLLNKKVYAGAFCCEYAGEHMPEFYIIKKQMVPNGPYWVNKEFMPQEHIDALIKHFEALTPENAVEGMFVSGKSDSDEVLGKEDRWVRVDPSFYGFLEKMYEGE